MRRKIALARRRPRRKVARMSKNKHEQAPSHSISNCSFVGVQFDAKAVDAIQVIAQGLLENAKALGSLAMVLQHSNIQIDAMLKIDSPKGASFTGK